MAYYVTHEFVGDDNMETQDVYFRDGKIECSKIAITQSLGLYKLNIPDGINDMLEMTFDWGGSRISYEALIYYIDVLGMQEDCKYQRYNVLKIYRGYNRKKRNHRFDFKKYEIDTYDRDNHLYKNHYGRINFISTLANAAFNASKLGVPRTAIQADIMKILDENVTVKPIPLDAYKSCTGNEDCFKEDD